MSFLDDVIKTKRAEVATLRLHPPALTRPVSSAPNFSAALRAPGLSVIAEIKRRSPSKGPLALALDVAQTTSAYARGGAVALSCLTDRRFFGALPEDFANARTASLPILRKDFLIDEIQIDESAAMAASAVLLIVRILPKGRLKVLLDHAASHGLDALVEVHDEAEIDQALWAGASIIGVNNRDLQTLAVDSGRGLRLRERIPRSILSVSESGVRTRDDVRRIADAGFDAVLIGETLATNPDPEATLLELTGAVEGAVR